MNAISSSSTVNRGAQLKCLSLGACLAGSRAPKHRPAGEQKQSHIACFWNVSQRAQSVPPSPQVSQDCGMWPRLP